MKIFFFMGRNFINKSGVSWKIWKINRVRRTVTTWWGHAKLIKRKVLPRGKLKNKSRVFPSSNVAEKFMRDLIESKIEKGYERRPRKHY